MRQYFTLAVLLIVNSTVLSQNTDSLRRLLNSKQNKERADLLFTLSKAYWYSHRDTALIYASEAMQISRNIAYARGIAEAYRHLGVINMYSSKSEIAEPQLDTALRLFQNLKDTLGMAATYNNIGQIKKRYLGKYQESILAFEAAIFLFQKLGNFEGMGSALNYLGLAYQQQGNFQKAIECLLQGMEVRKKIGDIQGAMFSLTRVGDMYHSLEQTETALNYYLEALDYANKNNREPLSDTYARLANLYMGTKRHEEAKKYIDLALRDTLNVEGLHLLLGRYYMETGLQEKALLIYEQIRKRTQTTANYDLLATSILEISKIYQVKKDYPAALEYAKNAYGIASNRGLRWMIADAANALSFLYTTQGNYRKAYEYEKIFRSISDSVRTADSRLKLAFLESRNEILEKQSSIELLNKENQLQEQRLKRESLLKKIFVGAIALIILVAFVSFRNVLLKRKNEKHQRELAENDLQIEKLENEKTKTELLQKATELEMQALRSQMNPHFIFNCLSSINRFILKNESETASDYLTKFSRLIRMVLNNSKNPLILLEDELEMLRLYLDLERLRFKNSFDYSISFYNHFDVSSIFIPPLLLQPFAENAIWHGLMHKEENGMLEVAFELDNNILNCYITDNGIGRKKAASFKSKSAETQKSLGMQITAGRLALLNKDTQQAFFTIEDLTNEQGQADGTKVTLKICYKENMVELSESSS